MDVKYNVLGEMNGLQEMMGNQMNGFKYENGGDTSDCFVVDLESFSNGVDKEHSMLSTINSNSRTTLQRSLSRKVPQRGAENKISDKDVVAPSSSPRAAQVVSTPEKSLSPTMLSMVTQDHAINNQQLLPQHQITIKTGGINTAIADGRWGRKSSFKRSSNTWFSDPKRILLFFATLSSMGTMLLIYFTLSVSKASGIDGALDWQ